MDSFSNLVKYCGAKKLEYSAWKTLHNWATKPDWSEDKDWEFCICSDEISDIVDIYPWHDLYLTPEVVTIVKSSSFGQFLLKAIKKGPEFAEMETTSNSFVTYSDNLINDFNALGCTSFYEPYTINIDSTALKIDNAPLADKVKEIVNDTLKEKEKNEMNFGNFDFGPVDSSVRMSMYGMAIKNASGVYVSYDSANKQIMDVDILNFDGAQKFMYKMPVPIKDIEVGDVVVHARKPMFVVAVRKDDKLAVVDPYAGEEKVIMLPRSPFGFNFATKVVSFLNFGTADASNPFGNMLPFLLMNDSKDADDILPFMLMMNGQSAMTSNPMLMYALMSKDNKIKEMLPFLMMAPQSTHTCCCGCHDENVSCDKEG